MFKILNEGFVILNDDAACWNNEFGTNSARLVVVGRNLREIEVGKRYDGTLDLERP